MKSAITIFLILSSLAGHSQHLAFDRLNALDKGCNLSNWLEAYWFSDDEYPPTGLYSQQDIKAMKLAGMNNVRLNVNFERLTDETSPYSLDINHEAFAWIDSILKWTAEENMMVVMCNQHGWDELNDFTFSNIAPRVIALWDQLAQKYKNTNPDQLLFEVINEPPALLSRGKARLLMALVVEIIREHSDEHTIVVSGSLGSHITELPNTNPLPDTNLIYTFHYYEPFYFTHQGASWTPIFFPIGAAFPNGFFNDETIMRNQFLRVHDWQQLYQVPVYMGEFGTINFGDEGSKCNWVAIMGDLIDQYQMNWSYWDCKFSEGDRFGFFDGDTISPFNIRQCYRQALHLYDDGTPTASGENKLYNVSIAPNPAHTRFAITGLGENLYDIEVFDVAGRPVMELRGIYNQSQIIISQLPPGVYLMTLGQNGRTMGMVRFIKSN